MVDHTFMALHVPLQTLWTPWTIIIPLMFRRSSLKTPIIVCMWLLIPFSRIYADLILKPTYIGRCVKGQIFLEFSLMWIRVTCLLAFHMPRDRSDLTFHYPNEALYTEPFGYIEEEELKRKKTIVHCCRSLLILESASLCPLEHLVFFSSCLCLWACYREMEDWGGGVLGGGLSFSDSQTCRQRLSLM